MIEKSNVGISKVIGQISIYSIVSIYEYVFSSVKYHLIVQILNEYIESVKCALFCLHLG